MATPIERVKRYLPPDHGYTDDDIQDFLDDNAQNVKLAAADALDAYATRRASDFAFAAAQGGSDRGPGYVDEIRRMAAGLREQVKDSSVYSAEANWEPGVDLVTGRSDASDDVCATP